MDDNEVRLRCIEAAARNPQPHSDGYPSGVLAAAKQWFAWVNGSDQAPDARNILGLPKKK